MSVAAGRVPYPHIVQDASVSGGQPVVERTRLSVATLVRAHQLGMDLDEILVQYPGLTAAELHAALLYYLDHKADMDRLLEVADSALAGAEVVRG